MAVAAFVPLANAAQTDRPVPELVRENFEFAAAQYSKMLESLPAEARLPRTFEHGKLGLIASRDWTSGFFPGSMWYIHEYTRDAKWRASAEKYTAMVEPEQHNTRTHDVGFILYCSAGNGLRLTNNAHYRDVLVQGAKSLITRFNPTVGAIRSWDHAGWTFPVIIDNMMNLELLFWAAKETKDSKFRDIAIQHADTTLKNHFRPDHSCVHVVDYDPATGKIIRKKTHQGIADESSWARGQAWGLYGYTLMYRETKDQKYLDQAVRIASFLLGHPRMPADKIPYWDYDDPKIPNAPRDASAAAIMASALLELSTYVQLPEKGRFQTFAEKQVRSLASPAYRAKLGENGNFILMHSTGNHPKNSEIDVPINYADYYFLEALLRLQALTKN